MRALRSLMLVVLVVAGFVAVPPVDAAYTSTAVSHVISGDRFSMASPAFIEDGSTPSSSLASVARTALARQTDDNAGEDDSVTVTLLHNNDGESKLLPDPEAGFPGIARFARTWIDLGRASDADILVRVSAGDNFLASKEFAAGLERDDLALYDSIALRGLYEAMALGNHDFDFGPEVTARFIDDFRLNNSADPVPFVSANIDVGQEPALQALVDEGRLAPSTIFTDPTSGLDIGIIGAVTARLGTISSPRGVIVDPDVAARVNAEAASLTERGVDRIVLVSHLQGLGEDRELVPQLRGVDIVVAGGGDELLRNDGDTCQPADEPAGEYPLVLKDSEGNQVPVVTAPGGYRCIGRLEVTFDGDGKVVDFSGSSIGVPVDGEAEQFAFERVERPLASSLAELEATIVASSEVALDGRRSAVRTGPSNEGELLADALLFAGQAAPDFGGVVPSVGIQNGGGIRNDAVIGVGDITEADTFDIAPFANFVVTGEVSRIQLKDLLEGAVAGLPDAEGTYPQIAGFMMEVDAAQPGRQINHNADCALIGAGGSRVRSVVLDDGTEIVRDGEVVAGPPVGLATIDFLANGGDCYPLAGLEFTKVGLSYQQALTRYLSQALDGRISADRYPEGGSRTTVVNLDAAESALRNDTAAEDTNQLPNTGIESWLVLIIAATVLAAGALIGIEAHRFGRLSLANRIHATRAWFPEHDTPDDDAK